MTRIARYARFSAHEGRGDELAEQLLAAADGLAAEPGCLIYLINRQAGEPDVLWVTELWRSQADLDAVSQRIRDSAGVAAALALTADFELVALDLLGGKGPGAT